MKISMIGKGAWGSAMGHALERNGHQVSYVERQHQHWPDDQAPELIFVALPTQVIRERVTALELPAVPVISLSKGLEVTTGMRVSQVLSELLPDRPVATLSGPSLAYEIELGLPTAVVIACRDSDCAELIQRAVHHKLLRAYLSNDLVGVEAGGALKNIFAIAGGICQGLKLGENGMAGLMSRSLAEMARMTVGLGGRVETIFGLSGMGDLILTSYSGRSRNHQVGTRLGKGEKLSRILSTLGGTAEGVTTAKAAFELAQKHDIKAPVTCEVYRVLHENKDPLQAMHDLLTREVTRE